MRLASRIALLVLALAVVGVLPAVAKQKDIDTEKKLGQEGAVEADKTLKIVKDEKMVNRVQTIGQQLASLAKTTKIKAGYGTDDLADFNYTFKVVEDKEVNAFSLPAGYIYVNTGLLKRVESDDELAGVLAHEIAHVAHHHMLKLLRKQAQLDNAIFLIIAAAAAGKVGGADMGNIFYGAKLLQMAKVNSYSIEAEKDADSTAVKYLMKTKYNPVGMLTFMEKLARDEAYNPVDPGVFQNHPYSRDRANNIEEELKEAGIKINRRAVSSGVIASVQDATVAGKKVSQVMIAGRVVFQPCDLAGVSSADRAKAVMESINHELDDNPEPRDVKLSPDGTGVYLKEELVVDVKPADADLAGQSREALATKAKDALLSALLSQEMQLMY